MRDTVLIVHGDAPVRDALAKALAGKGHCIVEAPTGRAGIDRASKGIDLAIIDCHLPDVDGLRVLEALTRQQPDALSIIATPHADVQTAVVQAMKMGAFQVVSQPFVPHALAAMVGPAIETGRLRPHCRRTAAVEGIARSIDPRRDPFPRRPRGRRGRCWR
jgi:two-component system response regulator AtoC